MSLVMKYVENQEELEAVFRMRYEVYVEQQGLFKDSADHRNRVLSDAYDASSRIFAAMENGVVVGTVRLTMGFEATFSQESIEEYELHRFEGVVSHGQMAVTSRFLVREAYRGGDLAVNMLKEIFKTAAENDMELIIASCEPFLVNHYRPLGYRPYGDLKENGDNGFLIPIVVVVGDLEHLREMHSPMLAPLALRTGSSTVVDSVLEVVSSCALYSQQTADPTEYQRSLTEDLSPLEEDGRILADMFNDPQQADNQLDRSHIIHCKPGLKLFVQDHVSRTMYILLSGSLDIYRNGFRTHQLSGSGSLAGEGGFFAGTRRMSDAVVGSQGARVLALCHKTLRRIVNAHQPLATRFLHYVACQMSRKLMLVGTAAQMERRGNNGWEMKRTENERRTSKDRRRAA